MNSNFTNIRIVAAVAASILIPRLAFPYEFEILYTGDIWSNRSGGLEEETAYLDNLNIVYTASLGDDFGFGAGTFLLHGLYNNNATFSDRYVGDLQAVSNIDAPGAWRLFEAIYIYDRQNSSLLAGLYDLNSEFDVNSVGAFFLHSSHGIGAEIAQSGENGPGIFPVSALTLRYEQRWDRIHARVAVLDGIPGDPDDDTSNRISTSLGDGLLTIAELDYALAGNSRLWGGYWHYTQPTDVPFDGIDGVSHNNRGTYIGAESEFGDEDFSRRWFLRYGVADTHLNVFDTYAGMGIVFGNRQDGVSIGSEFGVAVAAARTGQVYRSFLNSIGEQAADWEINIELNYKAQINDWLAIQPDIQYVMNPAGNKYIEDALVVGLRFELDVLQLANQANE